MELRKQISGVRTKKINKAFAELDAHMGWRYAIGYFFCLLTYFAMTLCVIIFNLFYPHDYIMGWIMNIVVLYLFDMALFTFGLAALQMGLIMGSVKIKCLIKVWAAIEVFMYVKNLRG